MRTKILPTDADLSNIYEKDCVYCGDTFYTDNENCIYCKDSCKTMAYLERKENDAIVDNEKHSDTNKKLPLNEPINADEIIDEYEKKIYDLEEQVRMSEARNRISDNEYLLLTGIIADKWFDKIYGEKPIILSFDSIIKNLPQLGEILVNDVGACELSSHGFRTTNFTLMYLCDNKKGYTVGDENKNDYLLTKNVIK